jgi:hypothetical protein
MVDMSLGAQNFLDMPYAQDEALENSFGVNKADIVRAASEDDTRYVNVQTMAVLSRTDTREFLGADEHANARSKGHLAYAPYRSVAADVTVELSGHTLSGLVSNLGAKRASRLLDCGQSRLTGIDFNDGRYVMVVTDAVASVEIDPDVWPVPDEFHHPEIHHISLCGISVPILSPILEHLPNGVNEILCGQARIGLLDGTSVMVECDDEFFGWIDEARRFDEAPSPVLTTTNDTSWSTRGSSICLIELPRELFFKRAALARPKSPTDSRLRRPDDGDAK